MKPGEVLCAEGTIVLNEGRPTRTVTVTNVGDRPVQVGSHFHFFEVNRCLSFDRAQAFGYRLDVPSGNSVRFEPGESKEVRLVEQGGRHLVLGLNDKKFLDLNHACAAKEKAGEKITPPGLPLPPEEHAAFITKDCIEVTTGDGSTAESYAAAAHHHITICEEPPQYGSV